KIDLQQKATTTAETKEEKEVEATRADFPPSPPHTEPPVRELHVKIWEQETTISPAMPEKQPSREESSIDHLPTTPLGSISSAEQPGLEEDNIEERPPLIMATTSQEQGRSAPFSSSAQAVQEQARLSPTPPLQERAPTLAIVPTNTFRSSIRPQNGRL